MRRLSFLLRPGWLVLIALCGAFVWLSFTVLAPWQLGKNDENSHRNSLIADSLQADPAPIGDLFDDRDVLGPEDEWSQASATGVYLADKQVLARLRSVGADPAFEVLAPFRLDDGRMIVVNRGYVRPDENMKPPEVPAPPAGVVTLDGRIRTSERTWGPRGPVVEGGWTQVYSIHTAGLSELLEIPLLGNYIQLNEDQPGELGFIALPQLDAGPYLSYGLQWIAFGVMVPLGAGYFMWAEIKERRRREPDSEDDGPLDVDASLDSDDPESANPVGADDSVGGSHANGSAAPPADDLEHVMLGRRKAKTPRLAPLAPKKAPRLPEHQATLAERYAKKR